jgi:hypothetical protein
MSSSNVLEPEVAATAHLEVQAGLSNVEIVVSDGLFREVARGTGQLSLSQLPPGLYEIEARSGGVPEHKLVSLKPGEQLTETIAAYQDVPTMAPVYGGATGREPHHAAATGGTIAVRDAAGPPAGLVVLVRTLRDRTPYPLRPDRMSLVDGGLRPVPSFATDWEVHEGDHWALWAGRLGPGGYALRTRGQDGEPGIDQSLWLSRDWTTIVVCPTGSDSPRTDDAAIHMLRLGDTWDSVDDRLASTLEVALSGLRQGVGLASDEMMRVLLQAKFLDPMLGIVGAHALRMRKTYDRGLLATVVDNLRWLVPDHPDALALRYAVAAPDAPRDLSWPPMLAASYRDLLLPAEYEGPHVLADGSVAERIAAYVVDGGPWLSWQVSEEISGRPQGPLPGAAAIEPDWIAADPEPGFAAPGYEDGATGPRVRYADQVDRPSGDDADPPSGRRYGRAVTTAAVRTVESYLNDAEHVLKRSPEDIALDLGVSGLARRTNLPPSTVSASLRALDIPVRSVGRGPG